MRASCSACSLLREHAAERTSRSASPLLNEQACSGGQLLGEETLRGRAAPREDLRTNNSGKSRLRKPASQRVHRGASALPSEPAAA